MATRYVVVWFTTPVVVVSLPQLIPVDIAVAILPVSNYEDLKPRTISMAVGYQAR